MSLPLDHFARGILRLLFAAYPAPSVRQDLLDGVPGLTAETLATLEKQLLAAGYIENANHADEPWWKITKAGMDQATKTGPLSRLVWGLKGTL